MSGRDDEKGLLETSRRSFVAGAGSAAAALAMVAATKAGAAAPSMLETASYVPTDKDFGQPFIDVDEQRRQPRPHRYVHGGFAGTDTRFSFYFPAKDRYAGRFMHWIEGGGGGNELSTQVPQGDVLIDAAGWAFLYDTAFDDLNGYLLETNQGYIRLAAPTGKRVAPWQASAESARFSRHVAKQIYGTAPHHGYVGGIGGGPLTQQLLENAADVYSGGTPQICPSSETSPWTAQARAQYFIGTDGMKRVIDALEPGGSGDPFASLSKLQREALSDMYRAGWPRGAENQLQNFKHAMLGMGAVLKSDPTYFTDFWTVPGYAGKDQLDDLKPYIVQGKAKVTRVYSVRESMEPTTFAWYKTLDPNTPFAVDVDMGGDARRFFGSRMTVTSGGAKDKNFIIYETKIGLSANPIPGMMSGVQVGDEVEFDNRDFIAFIHYFLHTIQSSDDFREKTGQNFSLVGRPFTTDGKPIHPQRPSSVSHGGRIKLKGAFEPKMIVVYSTRDIWGWPVMTDFDEVYKARYGAKLSDRYRLYWADGGSIAPPQAAGGFNFGGENLLVWETRMIDFQYSMGRQAWRYLKEWVEDGKAPPAGTSFSFSKDNELLLPATASERKGIQPVVNLTIVGGTRGGKRIDVSAGQSVSFEGSIDAPPGAGSIVIAEWDFLEVGDYPLKDPAARGTATSLRVKADHVFTKPGVYFVALRGGLHRDGAKGRGEPTHHLDRVRVVVS